MDIGTAVITLAAAAIALLPRVQVFTPDGRAQARIQRDIDMWRSMPKGPARDGLAVRIEASTKELLAERERDKTIERGWLLGTAWAGGGWLALVASMALTGTESWMQLVRTLLQGAGLMVGSLGALLLLLVVLLVVWRAVVRWAVLVRRRWKPAVPEYSI